MVSTNRVPSDQAASTEKHRGKNWTDNDSLKLIDAHIRVHSTKEGSIYVKAFNSRWTKCQRYK
jgi:hypothetical protein